MHESDHRGPHRNTAHEIAGAVDRVDDPSPRARRVADEAVLLTEHAVAGPLGEHDPRDGLLGVTVGLGDLRAVGLAIGTEGPALVERQGLFESIPRWF